VAHRLTCTVALSVAVLIAAAAPLRADPVRVDFVIRVLTTFTTFPGHEKVPPDILSLVAVGDIVRGSFAYDTTAIRDPNAPCQCFENAGTLTLALPISFGPTSLFLTADTFSLSAEGPPREPGSSEHALATLGFTRPAAPLTGLPRDLAQFQAFGLAGFGLSWRLPEERPDNKPVFAGAVEVLSASSPTPEPPTVYLLLSGLVAAGFARRRCFSAG
jgi:hypothetical protein